MTIYKPRTHDFFVFLGSLDYIQNNPGELPRVIFITVAGMGGIVLGYKGEFIVCLSLCNYDRSRK